MDEFTEEALLRKHFEGRTWEQALSFWTYTSQVGFGHRICDLTKFPYYAPGPHNPPLPTFEDIAKDPKFDPTDHKHQRHVRLIYGKYVVKFSTSKFLLQEAENLLFLAQHSAVKVPKLYAAYELENSDPLKMYPSHEIKPNHYFMVMENIEGDTLEQAWPHMTDPERQEISARIGHDLKLLREIPQPKEPGKNGPYYGRVGYQAVLAFSGIFGDATRTVAGPYDTWEEVVEEMASSAEKSAIMSNMSQVRCTPPERDLMRKFRPTLLAMKPEEWRPVFTHGDLRPRNIVLRPRNSRSQATSGKTSYGTDFDVVFLDWQFSAWFPAFYEIWAFPWDPESKSNESNTGIYYHEVAKAIWPHDLDPIKFLWSCDRLVYMPNQ